MPVTSRVVVGAGAAAAAAYIVWRRLTCPAVDLRTLAVELPPGVELLDPADAEDAVECLALAWSGSEATDPEFGFDWMLGAALRGKFADPERLRLLRWANRFFIGLNAAWGGGAIIVVRERGAVVAAAGVQSYPRGLPGPVGDFLMFAGAIARVAPRHGFGMLKAEGVSARFESAFPTVEAAHKQAAGARPHLHIGPVGVLPSHQGRKLTSVMLRLANEWADALGWCCYLECGGDRNPKIYARYGYEDVGGPGVAHGPLTMTCPKGEPPFEKFWSMRRPSSPP